MVPLDRGTFRAWLDEYAAAWETSDADAAARLFAPDATYRRTPFDDPLEGRDEIRTYWAETTATQESVSVDTTVDAVDRDRGFARFRASFVRDDDRVVLDGVLRARFGAGDCVSFREWWHAGE